MNSERLPRVVIALGASAGGLQAVLRIVSELPKNLPAAIAAVIHRSPTQVSHLAQVLGRRSSLPVTEALDGAPVERGRIYLAPPDLHLVLENDRFRLHRTPKVNFTRPAVDPLFRSAATAYGRHVVGVLLSGGGDDGVSGLIAIKAAGGLSIVQHPGDAEHPSMPVNAILFDDVDAILPLPRIASTLTALAAGNFVDSLGHETVASGAPSTEV
jgi:two-component system, chemotaxis family, protein-glutamate methylesterase/glutaminase